MAAATALVLRLNNMTYWIMWAATNLVQNLGIIEEGMRTIAQPVTLLDTPDAPDLQLTRGAISIERLTHRYGLATGGIEDLSLTIEAGKKVGLVGPSGAGKSTLVKLLLRFYDAESGADPDRRPGHRDGPAGEPAPRHRHGPAGHRRCCTARSRENILYGRPDATEDEMVEAARKARGARLRREPGRQ